MHLLGTHISKELVFRCCVSFSSNFHSQSMSSQSIYVQSFFHNGSAAELFINPLPLQDSEEQLSDFGSVCVTQCKRNTGLFVRTSPYTFPIEITGAFFQNVKKKIHFLFKIIFFVQNLLYNEWKKNVKCNIAFCLLCLLFLDEISSCIPWYIAR